MGFTLVPVGLECGVSPSSDGGAEVRRSQVRVCNLDNYHRCRPNQERHVANTDVVCPLISQAAACIQSWSFE